MSGQPIIIGPPGQWIRDPRRACAQHGVDPDVFFPLLAGDAAIARSICRRCPVWRECREYAISEPGIFGVWGGLAERERQTIRAQRRRDAAGQHAARASA